MKQILYICNSSPFESYSGNHQRTGILYKALRESGQVDLVCFTNTDIFNPLLAHGHAVEFFGSYPVAQKSRFPRVSSILHSLSPHSVWKKNQFCVKTVREILERKKYDFIVVRYLATALMCNVHTLKNVIIDVDDLPEEIALSYANDPAISLTKKCYRHFLARRARFHTNKILKHVTHSFFSNEKQAIFENSSHLPNIPYPRGHSTTERANEPPGHVIIFVGFMRYEPNQLGVDNFIANIWPGIRDAVPSARFRLIGKGLPETLRERWGRVPGVEIAGYIEDLAEQYRQAAAVVVPIYHGAGTHIKVLEAMSMGRPCVVSSFAGRGFEGVIQDGENVLIGGSSPSFADRVVQLLLNPALGARIGENAKRTVASEFSLDVIVKRVRKCLSQ